MMNKAHKFNCLAFHLFPLHHRLHPRYLFAAAMYLILFVPILLGFHLQAARVSAEMRLILALLNSHRPFQCNRKLPKGWDLTRALLPAEKWEHPVTHDILAYS